MYDYISKEEIDILVAQHIQILLQSTISDLVKSKNAYNNFRSMNALFVHEIEKNILKNVKDETKANIYTEILESSSTFALFINDCAAAKVVIDKADEVSKKYNYLSFNFDDFTETQKSFLMKMDAYEDSENMLNLYTNHLQDLMRIMTSCTPSYDFMRNLDETEKFIEEQTRVKIPVDPETAKETLEYLGIDLGKLELDENKKINNIVLSGVLSPRDPDSDTNQQEIFLYNRMVIIASYRDILKEHLSSMDKKYANSDIGTTFDVLQVADEIVAEYEKFVGEPMEADDYYKQARESIKMTSDYWGKSVEYGHNEEMREIVQELYINHCDENFNLNREIDKVKNGMYMA
ncbi:MAG: hypothetical protein J6X00_01055 [Clostridia bacterium]|nr:hypothetical protein [Clostridia bacterium]